MAGIGRQGLAKRIVFAWENLGPSHHDRIAACAADPALDVTAIEFFGTSLVYHWDGAGDPALKRVTLYPDGRSAFRLGLWWRLLRACRAARAEAVFLCHYSYPPVFIAALLLRLLGVRVVTMIDSKFDDMPRSVWREAIKAVLLKPYHGALAGSGRTADYLRMLGFGRRPIELGFDTLNEARIAALAQPSRLPHASRDFLIVARLIREKNLSFALRAYADWHGQAQHPRRLRILGGGPLEEELRTLATELGIADAVSFEGTASPAEVAKAMRAALALVFPSVQETYGFVVIEALALGLPVLVSSQAGAVDELIDHAGNGWVIDPHQPETLIAAMALLDRDEAAWKAAGAAALASAKRGDVRHFVAGVKALI